MTNIIRERVVPAALELVDGDSLEAVATSQQTRSLAPEGTGAILLLEVDGGPAAVAEDADAGRARLPRSGRDRGPAGAGRRGARASCGGCGASCRCRCG